MENFNTIFWDFDGVIKDSVEVKAFAFSQLFEQFGPVFQRRVVEHHFSNSGVPRRLKIPVYLEWAGLANDDAMVAKYADQFSQLVLELVISSPWVPGVKEILLQPNRSRAFFLVSAIPDEELAWIVKCLNISSCFDGVFGSSRSKSQCFLETIETHGLLRKDCVHIGDSMSDLSAAKNVGIACYIRQHEFNKPLCMSVNEKFLLRDFNALNVSFLKV